ncbi:MAG: ferritin-like domain-containing protein [Chromatiaceae bacterium]|nr:ferritin-like domain-containing protein [Gammaproteobacteria bacterium]MCP5301082.1 ferritin-like domain-containing protein [Chromatiaceae bacterium]MCP5421446.1 ferritin-like domain-containing protein [Chromatiaceae bacterium]
MATNLYTAAEACLQCRDVDDKCLYAKALLDDWRAARLTRDGSPPAPSTCDAGRPPRPVLVSPRELAPRGLGNAEGHAALVHAVAHIEFNAINLACDAVYRFRDLPDAYYGDWLQVAAEEAYHFSLLRDRLERLGYAYGDFPAHDGLWEMAARTAHDPLLRMALVPRVMEARGLDVTPGMRERFAAHGDQQTAAVLDIILRDEIGHVEAGSRWFRHLCARRRLDPEETYFALLEQFLGNKVRCPLHKPARLQAGFSETELGRLEALCKRS